MLLLMQRLEAMRALQEREPTRCDWLAKLEYGTIFELESGYQLPTPLP